MRVHVRVGVGVGVGAAAAAAAAAGAGAGAGVGVCVCVRACVYVARVAMANQGHTQSETPVLRWAHSVSSQVPVVREQMLFSKSFDQQRRATFLVRTT